MRNPRAGLCPDFPTDDSSLLVLFIVVVLTLDVGESMIINYRFMLTSVSGHFKIDELILLKNYRYITQITT